MMLMLHKRICNDLYVTLKVGDKKDLLKTGVTKGFNLA